MALVQRENKNQTHNEKANLKTVSLLRDSWEETVRQSNHPCFEYPFLPKITGVQKEAGSNNIQLMRL